MHTCDVLHYILIHDTNTYQLDLEMTQKNVLILGLISFVICEYKNVPISIPYTNPIEN